jgi:glucose dehydrogenase
MARVEQKYLVDRETVEHLVAMLRDGVKKGASDEEIQEQTWEILDSRYRTRTDQSLREMSEGRTKRFKNAEQMIRDLETR